MSHKTSSTLFALLTLVCMAIVTISFNTPVQAQSMPTNGNENNCMKCHEDLYFLHDTGNWFCIRESPMLCTDCHGGDPEAITQEMAHIDRAAHPVINEDVSKCQQCHPDKCAERVEIFDQSAGIDKVLVAAPYTPNFTAEHPSVVPVQTTQQELNAWINAWEIIQIILSISAALTIYIVYRIRHSRKEKK